MQEEEENQKVQNFQVCVRVRPSTQKENQKCLFCNENTLTLQTQQKGKFKTKAFTFDYVFDENTKTEYLFEKAIKPQTQDILNGYNYTIFAYGTTSTGKSHTIFGNNQQEGISFLILRELFKNQVKYKFSYLQIYNENIRDLLPSTKNLQEDQQLMVIEDPQKGVYVPDLTEYPVETEENAKNLILIGNTKRTISSTSQNQFSSRSHAIIQISDYQKGTKITIVDLAGSEQLNKSQQNQTNEGSNINRSLLALGNCINLLSDNCKKGQFIPYRDSKLTRLLKDSLGGNTRNIIIACVSGNQDCLQETINTLKYAERAKNIKKNVVSLQENQNKMNLIEGNMENIKKNMLFSEKDFFLSYSNNILNTSIEQIDQKCTFFTKNKQYYNNFQKVING